MSSQDLKSEYSSRATCGHQNQESSSEIRAESSGGHGFQNFGYSKSIVFTPRGKEPSYSGLFSIEESFWSWLSPKGYLDGSLEHQKGRNKKQTDFFLVLFRFCVCHCSCEVSNFG